MATRCRSTEPIRSELPTLFEEMSEPREAAARYGDMALRARNEKEAARLARLAGYALAEALRQERQLDDPGAAWA